MCPASIYQMIRGIIVLIVAAMAKIFLGRRYYSHHLVALAAIFIGIFIVGLSSILFKENSSSNEGAGTIVLGLILLVIS